MKRLAHLVLWAAIAWPRSAASAQEVSVPSTPAAPHLQITPVQGGIQMSNETFLLYLRTQVALEQCNLRVVARDALLQDAAKQTERSFWESHGIWVGVAVGFVVSTVAVWQVKGLLSK